MPNQFLVPETTAVENGTGPAVGLGVDAGGTLLLTLGITKTVEQQSLDVSVWGSPDGQNWGAKALLVFPQKFYAGISALLLDLRSQPEIRHLQARWQVARWGVGSTKPMFVFYLFSEPFIESAA